MVGPAGADVGHEGHAVAGLATTATTDDDAIDGTFNFALTPSHTPEHFYAYQQGHSISTTTTEPHALPFANSLQVLTSSLSPSRWGSRFNRTSFVLRVPNGSSSRSRGIRRPGPPEIVNRRGTVADPYRALQGHFVPFRGHQPSGLPIDVLTGFSVPTDKCSRGLWASRSTGSERC